MAINKWYTLCDNFPDLHAETLSQTGVGCSYVPYVIIAKYVPFQRHFYDYKKRLICYSMLNFCKTKSPFQSQLTILKNTMNNWHTLRDNISNQRAETLSQTGVSCSYAYVLSLQNMYPFRDIFTILKRRLIF